jgi:hypothetical protein
MVLTQNSWNCCLTAKNGLRINLAAPTLCALIWEEECREELRNEKKKIWIPYLFIPFLREQIAGVSIVSVSIYNNSILMSFYDGVKKFLCLEVQFRRSFFPPSPPVVVIDHWSCSGPTAIPAQGLKAGASTSKQSNTWEGNAHHIFVHCVLFLF